MLVAQREGSANCTTTFKLKDDFTFREKNICFGITEVKGIYRISNDTIYFDNVKRGKQEDVKYEFGVIEEPQLYTEHPFALRLFKDKKDRIGFFYWIANNKLKIKPIIKPNR